MKPIAFTVAMLAIVLLATSTNANSEATPVAKHQPDKKDPKKKSVGCKSAQSAVGYYHTTAHRWYEQTGSAARHGRHAKPAHCNAWRHTARIWRDRSVEAKKAFDAWIRSMLAKWGCIHRHEGSWSDPNPPYWGGLQMDYSFQKTYGAEYLARWGTADRWPIWAQLVVAERAYHGYAGYGGRGFGPWPNTARMCGVR